MTEVRNDEMTRGREVEGRESGEREERTIINGGREADSTVKLEDGWSRLPGANTRARALYII